MDDRGPPQDHTLPRQSRLARRAIPTSRLDRRDSRTEDIRASPSVDPVRARSLAERRVSLAPGAVDPRKIPHASATAVADGQAVIATSHPAVRSEVIDSLAGGTEQLTAD